MDLVARRRVLGAVAGIALTGGCLEWLDDTERPAYGDWLSAELLGASYGTVTFVEIAGIEEWPKPLRDEVADTTDVPRAADDLEAMMTLAPSEDSYQHDLYFGSFDVDTLLEELEPTHTSEYDDYTVYEADDMVGALDEYTLIVSEFYESLIRAELGVSERITTRSGPWHRAIDEVDWTGLESLTADTDESVTYTSVAIDDREAIVTIVGHYPDEHTAAAGREEMQTDVDGTDSTIESDIARDGNRVDGRIVLDLTDAPPWR